MNNRRKLAIALGAGTLTIPFASIAQQQGKVWRVGFLALRQITISDTDYYYGPFRQGMRELGYIEGNNLFIEWRSAEGNPTRLPSLAAELVNLKVDVIVAPGTPATRAAQKATATIPIVMGSVGDPIASGFVKSLARPLGNITGTTNLAREVMLKQLEMLLSTVPKLSRVAVLVNPSNTANINGLMIVEAAGQKRNIKILRAEAQTPHEIDGAFSLMRQQNAGALIVSLDSFLQQQKLQIAELTEKYRLPSISLFRESAEAGVLMSYGPSLTETIRRTATYVDKIFKGAKPGDLPVEQPTKFEMIINGKTAKALGLKIPQSLLVMADKVIE
jgi:putative ABC transport system substrate-binding protein